MNLLKAEKCLGLKNMTFIFTNQFLQYIFHRTAEIDTVTELFSYQMNFVYYNSFFMNEMLIKNKSRSIRFFSSYSSTEHNLIEWYYLM